MNKNEKETAPSAGPAHYFGLCRPFVACGVGYNWSNAYVKRKLGWLFSLSEAPDAISRVHVDLARQPYFRLETDFMPAFQVLMHSHKDVSLMQFQGNACLFYNKAK